MKIILLAVAAGAGVILILQPQSVLPRSIGNPLLIRLVKGREADAILNGMHDKKVAPGHKRDLNIWRKCGECNGISINIPLGERCWPGICFDGASHCEWQLDIQHYSIVQVKDTVVSFCVRKGLHHYFLTSKNALYWLTVDPAIAEMVSDDLVMSL